jgi:hypothetical protein
MDEHKFERKLQLAVRDGITRTVGIVGLCGMALIHAIDAPGHFGGADTYVGFMYIALIIASLGLAGGLIRSGDKRIWVAAGGLTVSVIVGYVLSRTTGLPASSDDIGNWGEPLGIASLFVEGSLLALAGFAFASTRASRQPRRAEAGPLPAMHRSPRETIAA